MKHRAKDLSDKNYAGRGIGVCIEWEDFKKFYADMREGYSDNLTIERKDVNRSYCKENCIWLSIFKQQANKRNNRVVVYQGEKMHLAELRRRSGVSKMKLLSRLNRGMSADEAVESARNSTYGTGRHALKGRMSTTS